jgi:hypothetical protein
MEEDIGGNSETADEIGEVGEVDEILAEEGDAEELDPLQDDVDEESGLEVDDALDRGELEMDVSNTAEAVTLTKVKRPTSAWMYYMNENRNRVREANPNLSIGEISKVLSQEYKSLSQDLVDVYINMANKDKERYNTEKSLVKNIAPRAVAADFPPLKDGETILPLVRLMYIVFFSIYNLDYRQELKRP